MFRRVVYVVLIVLCLLPATAKAQIFLEEGKVVLAVAGGDRINKTITVSNSSKEMMIVKVYWEDFEYKSPYNDGSKDFFPAGVGPASASKWIAFTPQEFTLPAFGKQKIEYSVNVPPQIEKGHYGVLFFEKTDEPSASNTGIAIVSRVGSLFFIEPKDAVKVASLEKISSKASQISGEFINKSSVTLLPRMVYYIMEEGGLVKDRGELKKLYVPVGASASWELSVPEEVGPGRYSIVLNADLGDENVITKEISFTKSAAGLTIESSQ